MIVVKKHDICTFDAGTGSTAQRVAPHHILRDINTLSCYYSTHTWTTHAPPLHRQFVLEIQLPRPPTLDNRKDITTWSTLVQDIIFLFLALESSPRRMHDTRHDDDTRRSALGLRALALLHWPV